MEHRPTLYLGEDRAEQILKSIGRLPSRGVSRAFAFPQCLFWTLRCGSSALTRAFRHAVGLGSSLQLTSK